MELELPYWLQLALSVALFAPGLILLALYVLLWPIGGVPWKKAVGIADPSLERSSQAAPPGAERGFTAPTE